MLMIAFNFYITKLYCQKNRIKYNIVKALIRIK